MRQRQQRGAKLHASARYDKQVAELISQLHLIVTNEEIKLVLHLHTLTTQV